MDHTNKETLSAFIDNKLIGKIKIEVINHLRQCEECRLLMTETSLFINELKKNQSKSDTLAVNNTTKNVYKMLYKYLTPLALAASVVLVLLPIIHIQDSNAPQMTSIKDINAYNEGIEATAQTPPAQEVSKESSAVTPKKMAPIVSLPVQYSKISAPAPVESSDDPTASMKSVPVESFMQPTQLVAQAPAAIRSSSPMPKLVSSVPSMNQFVSTTSIHSDSAVVAVASKAPEHPKPIPVPVTSIAIPEPAPIAMASAHPDLILDPIYFEVNKLSITATMQKQIRENIAKLKNNNMMSYVIRLEGHSHNAGGEEYNYPLSLQMAKNVKAALIAEGIAMDQISTIGLSNTQPICNETTLECRAKNNRVEFIVHIH